MIVCMIGIFILTCTAKKAKLFARENSREFENQSQNRLEDTVKTAHTLVVAPRGELGADTRRKKRQSRLFCLFLLFSPEIGKKTQQEKDFRDYLSEG